MLLIKKNYSSKTETREKMALKTAISKEYLGRYHQAGFYVW